MVVTVQVPDRPVEIDIDVKRVGAVLERPGGEPVTVLVARIQVMVEPLGADQYGILARSRPLRYLGFPWIGEVVHAVVELARRRTGVPDLPIAAVVNLGGVDDLEVVDSFVGQVLAERFIVQADIGEQRLFHQVEQKPADSHRPVVGIVVKYHPGADLAVGGVTRKRYPVVERILPGGQVLRHSRRPGGGFIQVDVALQVSLDFIGISIDIHHLDLSTFTVLQFPGPVYSPALLDIHGGVFHVQREVVDGRIEHA